ncbi:TIR domain-containing protein [candidate division KSB3 bacterium]|uniref:TIR domain-containing protein n=1 Tax=candidate division KSB3 bacterium TaxID=2044937 RepID=A0A9D5JSD8_9BACT|nr:TIR domain-containing protein [candidate division KSB3 bacterium]MBD3323387.1 TIR domain-containing protein [candidate division KSB3 bacterium]
MQIPRPLQHTITKFLMELPGLHDAESQRAFILSAGFDPALEAQIHVGLPTAQFVPLLLGTALRYGKLQDGRWAVQAALEAAQDRVGSEKQRQCERLIDEYCSYMGDSGPPSQPSLVEPFHPPEPFFRPLKVFLCHSSKDKPLIRDLHRQLSALRLDLWFDEESLLPGQEWRTEITKAIRAADVVIICLSRHAVSQAGYLHREIRHALDIAAEQPEGTIFLIPLRLEDCPLPEKLRHVHWVNYFEEAGYQKLRRALQARATELGISAENSPNF